jgi:inner membrane protein
MDPLTQGLLGAAVGHAVAGRQLGRAAIFVGFLGGQAPDLDVLMVSDDSSIDYWRYHRGITHSLFFAPVVSVPLVAASLWVSRTFERFKNEATAARWYVYWLLVLITHPMLDFITHFGTKLFTPLTEARYGISALPVIEPIYSLILALALLAALRGNTSGAHARKTVCVALAVSTAYIGLGWQANIRAGWLADRDLAQQNITHGQIYSYSTMFMPWLRRVVVETTDGHAVGYVSVLIPRQIRWRPVASDPRAEALMKDFAKTEEGEIFFAFANGPLKTEVESNGDGTTQLKMSDMRYGYPGATLAGLWGLGVSFNGDGSIKPAKRYAVPVDITPENIVALVRANFGLGQSVF